MELHSVLTATSDNSFACVADNVVPDYITSKIVRAEFTVMGDKTTVCLLTIDNGFEIVGTSACVDPNNFNVLVGQHWAAKQALDKLEELDGFLRQSQLAKGATE